MTVLSYNQISMQLNYGSGHENFEYFQMQYYILYFKQLARISFDYTLNCKRLLRLAVIKDLGIFLTSNLVCTLIFFIKKAIERCLVMLCATANHFTTPYSS